MSTQNAAPALALHDTRDQDQFLTFQSAGDTFAIPIVHIREIIEYGHVTSVPMMPDFINGVINLRGRVVPVIDLAACFGSATSAISRRTCIVIVEMRSGNQQQDVGAIVDHVNEVLEVGTGEIEPPPSFGTHIRTDFIEGMAKIEGRFVVILDVSRVLDLDEIAQVQEVVAETSELSE